MPIRESIDAYKGVHGCLLGGPWMSIRGSMDAYKGLLDAYKGVHGCL